MKGGLLPFSAGAKAIADFPKPAIRQEMVKFSRRMTGLRDLADLRAKLRSWCSRPIQTLSMVALCCDAAPKADLGASCSEKPMPDDREADNAELLERNAEIARSGKNCRRFGAVAPVVPSKYRPAKASVSAREADQTRASLADPGRQRSPVKHNPARRTNRAG